MEKLADRYSEVSSKGDGRKCRKMITEIDGIVEDSFEPNLPDRLYIKAKQYLGLKNYTHVQVFEYASVIAALRRPPLRTSNFSSLLLDRYNKSTEALTFLAGYDKPRKTEVCAIELSKAIVLKIIGYHVTNHEEYVFKRTWANVALAITYSRVESWVFVVEHSFVALRMMEDTFGRNSVKYEVYGWAKYIAEVAQSKFNRDPTVKRELLEYRARFSKLNVTASKLIANAEDRVANANFKLVMQVLFPSIGSK